ncbi:TPA: DUF1642 domain-containing protein [Enterococcus faecalis]
MNKQELIEKYKTKYAEEPKDWRLPSVNASRQALYSNFINDLEKLDEPKKVVVPKFVADELEKLADKYLTLRDIYTGDVHWLNNGTVYLEGKELELANWLNKNETTFEYAWIHGYEVEKEQLYWAVRGVTDYFRCDEKIIVFKKEEEALEVANLIGINTEVKKMNSIDCSECISIEELRNENEEPLFYVALPKIGDTEFCYLWTDTDGAVYTQGNKGLCIGRLKHTEQEIKSIDERYWPFAVKVGNE